jgi:hypothetical protein
MLESGETPGVVDLVPGRIDTAYRQAAIVTGAIGGSLVIYLVLVELLRRTLPAPSMIPDLEIMRIALFVLAGMMVFSSTVIKSVMLRNAPADVAQRLTRLRTASILAAALSEIPAMLGLVLFLVGRMIGDFYILGVVSLYMLVRHYPRRDQWENYVRHGGVNAAR